MKYNCKKLSVLFAAVMMFVLACPVTVLAAAEEEAGTPAVYATFWSLIPPVVAIVLALITKEVYSSLFLGILVGALLYSGGNFEGTVNHIFSGGMISVLSSGSNVGILVFLVILGTMVCLMNRAGGSAAFGRWAGKHIKTRVGAELATILQLSDGRQCYETNHRSAQSITREAGIPDRCHSCAGMYHCTNLILGSCCQRFCSG